MIKQIRYRNSNNWLVSGRQKKWALCSYPVFSIFDIPADANIVWLTAHERSGANRVEVKLGSDFDDYEFIKIDGKRSLFLFDTRNSLVRLLKEHGTFYVSAEYTI